MTQEEKNLLLKDLCARLPHKQKVCYKIHDNSEEITETLSGALLDYFKTGKIAVVKPYLRPMSSMTEEEIYEYNKLVELDRSDKETFNNLRIDYIQNHLEYKNMPFVPMYRHIDYLNTHRLDYRGLIPFGLALPAPEGMYK